jgi:hypothetical protein
MTKIDWTKLKLEAVEVDDNQMVEYEQPEYEQPNDDQEYIVAVGNGGTAIFLHTPNIHECFFENARDHLDDNGFAIPDDLCAGVYRMKFHYFSSTDWETGYVDDWGFDCIGNPELLYEFEEPEENEDNL